MIDGNIKKFFQNEQKNLKFNLSIDNIERLKAKGILKEPEYPIPNSHYFIFKDNQKKN